MENRDAENSEATPLSPGVESSPPKRAVAPAWHAAALVVAIVALSAISAKNQSSGGAPVHLLASYLTTGAMELVLLGWVVFGLWLGNTRLSALLGSWRTDLRSIALDAAIALAFWFASLMVLGTLGLAWTGAEYAIAHRQTAITAGQKPEENSSQQRAVRTLSRLAPSNKKEIAGWVLLCILAGVAEEIVFRGYLVSQFTHWTRGRAAAGIALSAVCFGAAHAYQGARGMFLIAVFGALFSLLALLRGSLRPGIFAHSWHDLITGLALALLKAKHLI